jgi:hypothetical protein
LTQGHERGILKQDEGKMSAQLKVDAYAGYKANQRPLAFSLGKKRLQIKRVVDQWYGPDHVYFKVLAEDANSYILRYSEADDQWDLVFFKNGDYQGEVSPGMGQDASS